MNCSKDMVHEQSSNCSGSTSMYCTSSTDPLGSLAFITASTKQQVCRGEYIDFRELLPVSPMTEEGHSRVYWQTNGAFTRHHPSHYDAINCFSAWLLAWNNYERLVMSSDPSLYHEMVTYRELMHFTCLAVSAYDQRFRSKIAQTTSF